jgi:hypothetical protein
VRIRVVLTVFVVLAAVFTAVPSAVVAATPAPTLTSFTRESPTEIRDGQKVSISYKAAGATAITKVVFGFVDAALVRREAKVEGSAAAAGPATVLVATTWAAGTHQLQDITVTDSAGRFQTYRRDGSATFGPDGTSGVTTHAFPFTPGDFTVIRKPNAPTGVLASPANSGAYVTWTPGAGNGSPIHAYEVQATPGGAIATTSGGATAALVQSLTPGTNYTFTVTAYNAVGASSVSAPSAATKPTSGIRVTAPVGREVWRGGETKTISWAYTSGAGSTVAIDLFDGPTLVQNIAAAAPVGTGGAGSFAWTLPNTIAADYRYRVRVTSNAAIDYGTREFSVRRVDTPAPKQFVPSGKLLQLYGAAFMGKGGGTSIPAAQAADFAGRFDFIGAQRRQYINHLDTMRALNSRFRGTAYVNAAMVDELEGASYPESWYLRDSKGVKVRARDSKNYLMYVGLPAWQDFVGEECTDIVSFGWDGCIFDVLGTGPLIPTYTTSPPVNPKTGHTWTKPDWINATTQIVARAGEVNPSAMMTGNGLRDGGGYAPGPASSSQLLTVMQGCMAELWLRTNPFAKLSVYKTEAKWKQDVDMLIDAAKKGKSVFVMVKPWQIGGVKADKDKWHRYALASFLLGTNGTHYFTFPYTHDVDALMADHPWDHVDVGQPIGTNYYSKLTGSGGYYYGRTFTNGMALVNPTGASVTISLSGGPYIDLGGVSRNSITLPPNTGEVLVKTITPPTSTTTSTSTTTTSTSTTTTSTSTTSTSTTSTTIPPETTTTTTPPEETTTTVP